ncbi:MAG: glycosyltransferase family 2 protein [Akkermansiaceae bacterium]|nr:glycosyltransferase family 2 protein [Akkermansiaceae bacterium]MCP5549110.1 glycosyltransferase family 2 protein [Akkermansiaceae bacterium]
MKVTVLIVTRNRAADLRQTLDAMLSVRVPDDCEAELMVVDNGSTDETPEVAKSRRHGAFDLVYLSEPRRGKSHGLNLGIEQSKGDVVIFTDDDVRPPAEWLEAMCEPIVSGSADVVAGGVKLAPHLLRTWMTPSHRSWLASTEWLTPGKAVSLVGANMAVSRAVFEKVPGFDPELGGGGLGFCEDGLFAAQLREAGFRFADRFDVCIEHHCDASRLDRASWLSAAENRGISHAYRGHHWEHWGCRFGALKLLRAKANLAMWRLMNRRRMSEEGCPMEELELVFVLGVVRGHLAQLGRSRNYERHGLSRIR